MAHCAPYPHGNLDDHHNRAIQLGGGATLTGLLDLRFLELHFLDLHFLDLILLLCSDRDTHSSPGLA